MMSTRRDDNYGKLRKQATKQNEISREGKRETKRRAKTQCLKRRIVDLGQFCHFH